MTTDYDYASPSSLEAKAFAQAAADREDIIWPQVATLFELDLDFDKIYMNPTEIGYDFIGERGNILFSCDTNSSRYPVQFYDEEDGFGWECDYPKLAAQTYVAIQLRRLQRKADQS